MKSKTLGAKGKRKKNDKAIIYALYEKYMNELADEIDKVGDGFPEDPFLADREEYYSKVLKLIAITGAEITLQGIMKEIGIVSGHASEELLYKSRCFLTKCYLSLISFMEGKNDA